MPKPGRKEVLRDDEGGADCAIGIFQARNKTRGFGAAYSISDRAPNNGVHLKGKELKSQMAPLKPRKGVSLNSLKDPFIWQNLCPQGC